MNQIVIIKKAADCLIVYTKGQLMKKEREEIAAHFSAHHMMVYYRSVLDGKPA